MLNIDKFAKFLHKKSWLDRRLDNLGKWWLKNTCMHEWKQAMTVLNNDNDGIRAIIFVCWDCDSSKSINV